MYPFLDVGPGCSNPSPLLYSLQNSNFNASSVLYDTHFPVLSRFGIERIVNVQPDVWIPSTNMIGQWIQVDFNAPIRIEQIEIRPRPTASQWISSYKLALSSDGVTYEVMQALNDEDRIFNGPTSETDYVTTKLNITTRFLRLLPQTFESHMALSWEVYTCIEGRQIKLT